MVRRSQDRARHRRCRKAEEFACSGQGPVISGITATVRQPALFGNRPTRGSRTARYAHQRVGSAPGLMTHRPEFTVLWASQRLSPPNVGEVSPGAASVEARPVVRVGRGLTAAPGAPIAAWLRIIFERRAAVGFDEDHQYIDAAQAENCAAFVGRGGGDSAPCPAQRRGYRECPAPARRHLVAHQK